MRAILVLAALAERARAAKHVVLVLADDLGWSDLGFRGSGIATPHLDALANEGVVFEHLYVQRACSPTRAALLTARYNIRYGMQSGVLEEAVPYGLDTKETLLPALLKEHGAVSKAHAIGKWHLGYASWSMTPTFRGFDSFFGYYSGAMDYYTHVGGCGGRDLHFADGANQRGVVIDRNGTYSTHLFTERAVDVVSHHDATEGGLFVYLAYQAVHSPNQVPDRYAAPYDFPEVEPSVCGVDAGAKRNTFAGMLAALDEGVGNVTDALDRAGMRDETLIWFQTDNGAPTPACGGWTGSQNWPLRGGKCTAWDGGLRGVAFASGAGVAGGRSSRHLAHTVDAGPTFLDALGGDWRAAAAAYALDGISQWGALDGSADAPPPRNIHVVAPPELLARSLIPADAASTEYPRRGRGAAATRLPSPPRLASAADLRRNNRYSSHFPPQNLTCGGDQHATPYYALRWRSFKLIIGDPGDDGGCGNGVLKGVGNGWWGTGPPCPAGYNNSQHLGGPFPAATVQLFDLERDPAEATDVSAAFPEVVANLTRLVATYNASAVDPSGVCAPADPRQDPALHGGACLPWLDDEA